MRETKIIEPLWEDFAEKVIPDSAPAVQIKEMEKAFYSGALILFQLISDAAALEEDDGLEKTTEIYQELREKVSKYMPLKKEY